MKKGRAKYKQSVATLALTEHDHARYRRYLTHHPECTGSSYIRALVMQDICEWEVEAGMPLLPNDISPWSEVDMFESAKTKRYMTGLTPSQARAFEVACHIKGVKMSDALRSLAVRYSHEVEFTNQELFKQLIALSKLQEQDNNNEDK